MKYKYIFIMDKAILILIAIFVIVITALILLHLSKSSKGKNENMPQAVRNPAQINQNINPNIPRNLQRNRLRNRGRQINRNDDDDGDLNLDSEEDYNVLEGRHIQVTDVDDELGMEPKEKKKIGTKKLAKLEEKAARRERNEQIQREREERKARDEELYQARKKREEEEERLEKEKEQTVRKVKEEQQKREYEEYLKLKEHFTVDEIGEEEVNVDVNSENLLKEFVNFIKRSKIVLLEDLAAEFKLKTQDVINRINHVQEMGILTGVMDDRGKFIHVSEDELMKVKKFIEQRGRVNITDLAKESSELVNLNAETIKTEA